MTSGTNWRDKRPASDDASVAGMAGSNVEEEIVKLTLCEGNNEPLQITQGGEHSSGHLAFHLDYKETLSHARRACRHMIDSSITAVKIDEIAQKMESTPPTRMLGHLPFTCTCHSLVTLGNTAPVDKEYNYYISTYAYQQLNPCNSSPRNRHHVRWVCKLLSWYLTGLLGRHQLGGGVDQSNEEDVRQYQRVLLDHLSGTMMIYRSKSPNLAPDSQDDLHHLHTCLQAAFEEFQRFGPRPVKYGANYYALAVAIWLSTPRIRDSHEEYIRSSLHSLSCRCPPHAATYVEPVLDEETPDEEVEAVLNEGFEDGSMPTTLSMFVANEEYWLPQYKEGSAEWRLSQMLPSTCGHEQDQGPAIAREEDENDVASPSLLDQPYAWEPSTEELMKDNTSDEADCASERKEEEARTKDSNVNNVFSIRKGIDETVKSTSDVPHQAAVDTMPKTVAGPPSPVFKTRFSRHKEIFTRKRQRPDDVEEKCGTVLAKQTVELVTIQDSQDITSIPETQDLFP